MGVMDLGRMGKKELGTAIAQLRGEKETLLDQLTAANEEIQRLNKELEKTREELENSRASLQASQADLEDAQKKLETRALELDDAGSIAEASLRVNGVFFAAQKAADQYIESVRQLRERQEEVCARRASESKREAEALITSTTESCDKLKAETEAACAARVEETEAICSKKLADTEAEAEGYWKELTERLENFYDAHAGMRELLASVDIKVPVHEDVASEEVIAVEPEAATAENSETEEAESGKRKIIITEL